MNELRKIGQKVGLGVLVVLGLTLLYDQLQYEKDLERYVPIAEKLETAQAADIWYFGDCSDHYHAPGEGTRITETVEAGFPELSLTNFSENGFHARIFYQLLDALAAREEQTAPRKRTVVVTLNLRAFAPHITHDYIYSPRLYQELMLIDPNYPSFANRLRLSFNNERNTDPSQMNRWVQADEDKPLFTNSPNVDPISLTDWKLQFPGDTLAQSYLNDLAFEIDEHHPRIKDFDQIGTLAKSQGWDLWFHLVPVNFDLADSLVGPELHALANRNLNFLIDRYEQSGARIIDNSHTIPADGFVHLKSNSHLFARSKQVVGERIVEAVGMMR